MYIYMYIYSIWYILMGTCQSCLINRPSTACIQDQAEMRDRQLKNEYMQVQNASDAVVFSRFFMISIRKYHADGMNDS